MTYFMDKCTTFMDNIQQFKQKTQQNIILSSICNNVNKNETKTSYVLDKYTTFMDKA